jgi:hypothetical protein
MDPVRAALRGQYHGAMDMLRGAIEACPDDLWVAGHPPRSFWRLAYHTLFFGQLYLEVRYEDFKPWEHHRDEVESDAERERLDARPYTQAELLTYWDWIDEWADGQFDRIDLASPDSGFSWYKMPKLDHVILNIRHISEHAGQLRDRLLEAGIDQKWHSRRDRHSH